MKRITSFILMFLACFQLMSALALAEDGNEKKKKKPFCGTGLSRPVQFTSLARGIVGGTPHASELVIKTKKDYKKFFGENLPQVPVNFKQEEVIVVSMGSQTTGGYSIEITGINIAGPSIGLVEITERKPAVGSRVSMAITSPFHAVKVPKIAYSYRFTRTSFEGNLQAAFTTLDLYVFNENQKTSVRFFLEQNGKVLIRQTAPNIRYAPVEGVATRDEVRAVNEAFKNANVKELPTVIPDRRLYMTSPTKMQLTSIIGSETHVVGATLGKYDGFEDRLAPLMSALGQIANRIGGIEFIR